MWCASPPHAAKDCHTKGQGALLGKPQLQESQAGKAGLLLNSPVTEKLVFCGPQLGGTAPWLDVWRSG